MNGLNNVEMASDEQDDILQVENTVDKEDDSARIRMHKNHSVSDVDHHVMNVAGNEVQQKEDALMAEMDAASSLYGDKDNECDHFQWCSSNDASSHFIVIEEEEEEEEEQDETTPNRGDSYDDLESSNESFSHYPEMPESWCCLQQNNK